MTARVLASTFALVGLAIGALGCSTATDDTDSEEGALANARFDASGLAATDANLYTVVANAQTEKLEIWRKPKSGNGSWQTVPSARDRALDIPDHTHVLSHWANMGVIVAKGGRVFASQGRAKTGSRCHVYTMTDSGRQLKAFEMGRPDWRGYCSAIAVSDTHVFSVDTEITNRDDGRHVLLTAKHDGSGREEVGEIAKGNRSSIDGLWHANGTTFVQFTDESEPELVKLDASGARLTAKKTQLPKSGAAPVSIERERVDGREVDVVKAMAPGRSNPVKIAELQGSWFTHASTLAAKASDRLYYGGTTRGAAPNYTTIVRVDMSKYDPSYEGSLAYHDDAPWADVIVADSGKTIAGFTASGDQLYVLRQSAGTDRPVVETYSAQSPALPKRNPNRRGDQTPETCCP